MTSCHLRIWRQGWAVAAITSWSDSPLALASTSARSRSVTINWSRSLEERSFIKTNAITNTTSEMQPEMMNCDFQPLWPWWARK